MSTVVAFAVTNLMHVVLSASADIDWKRVLLSMGAAYCIDRLLPWSFTVPFVVAWAIMVIVCIASMVSSASRLPLPSQRIFTAGEDQETNGVRKRKRDPTASVDNMTTRTQIAPGSKK